MFCNYSYGPDPVDSYILWFFTDKCGTLDGKPLRGNVNRFPLPAPARVAETYLEKNRLIEDMFCHEKL